MMTFIKQHKTTAWLLALLAACGIAIAAADLAGNANKTCADAGLQGANTEMMTLDLVKQSESNPIDWQQERKLRKAIDELCGDMPVYLETHTQENVALYVFREAFNDEI